jgi:hypothetical protein
MSKHRFATALSLSVLVVAAGQALAEPTLTHDQPTIGPKPTAVLGRPATSMTSSVPATSAAIKPVKPVQPADDLSKHLYNLNP